MGDSEDVQSFVEYRLTSTNTQVKRRSEEEEVTRDPNTLKEAMELPEVAG